MFSKGHMTANSVVNTTKQKIQFGFDLQGEKLTLVVAES